MKNIANYIRKREIKNKVNPVFPKRIKRKMEYENKAYRMKSFIKLHNPFKKMRKA